MRSRTYFSDHPLPAHSEIQGTNSGDSIPIFKPSASFPVGLVLIFSPSFSPAYPEISHPPVAVRFWNAVVVPSLDPHSIHCPDTPASWILDPASVAPSPAHHPCLPNVPWHCSKDTPPPAGSCLHAPDSSPHSARQIEDNTHPLRMNENAPAINDPGSLHGN